MGFRVGKSSVDSLQRIRRSQEVERRGFILGGSGLKCQASASLVRKSVSSRCVALSSRLTVASSTWLWASAASVLARLATLLRRGSGAASRAKFVWNVPQIPGANLDPQTSKNYDIRCSPERPLLFEVHAWTVKNLTPQTTRHVQRLAGV